MKVWVLPQEDRYFVAFVVAVTVREKEGVE